MRLGMISGPDDRQSLEETAPARRGDRAQHAAQAKKEYFGKSKRAKGASGVEAIELLNGCDCDAWRGRSRV
jgi:hypothetical protein